MKSILFRIPMPLTTEEYNRGQQWTINEETRLEGAETCEIIKNQPFENQLELRKQRRIVCVMINIG